MTKKPGKDDKSTGPDAETEAGRDGRPALIEVEIYVAGERVTLLDRRASAPPLYGIRRLTAAQRAALIIYGAVLEELTAPGGASQLGVRVSGGGHGGGGAVDRRLRMIHLRDLAWVAIGVGPALSPAYRAAAAEGEAELGPAHASTPPRGQVGHDPRQPIARRIMADAICRDGASICDVLKAHGWRPQGRAHERAATALAEIGQDLADAWNGLERRIAGETSGFTEVRAFRS